MIFEQRIDLMRDQNVSETVTDMRHTLIEGLVAKHIPEHAYPEQWDVSGLREELQRVIGLDHCRSRTGRRKRALLTRRCCRRLQQRVDRHMAAKSAQWGPEVMPLRREDNSSADARSPVARAPHHARSSARQVIGLRGYGQRDPLQEYKSEAFELFRSLISHMREAVTAQLMRVEIVPPDPEATADACNGGA